MLNKPRLPRDPLQTWIEVVLDPVDQRIIELISEYPFLCAVNDQFFKFEIKPSLVQSSGALERQCGAEHGCSPLSLSFLHSTSGSHRVQHPQTCCDMI
jgi:hypothetical protein